VRAQALPPPPGAPSPEALRPWLEPSVFIQSGHPDIVRQARQITAGLPNRLDQVLALNRWVHGRIAKNPAVSLPSALDVLRRREGDCNEHTYLFVALARAVGIPAQVRVGLVYLPGGFFYHAWPAVYVNGWVELDPTLGQDAVDAAHISLLEGEVGSQIRILALLGQVSAEILETDYD